MNIFKLSLGLLATVLAYLLLWPTRVEPVAWTPQPSPAESYAYNEKLKGIQKLALGLGQGPEGVNVDAAGRIYAGYADGRIMQFSANAASYIELANTGGRPLGISFGPNGGLLIADAKKGLLQLGMKVAPLVSSADDLPFGFTDDVDNTLLDKNVYFTDASWKFGYGQQMLDALEHGANGRLLEYNVASKQTRVLMQGLHFANGVAVGPDDAYVLVNETTEYRILRYWLKGEKAGTHDVFIDNLPGFPDNLSFNNRDKFWVALYGPRDAQLDGLLPGHFFLRKLLSRLPAFLQPHPKKHAFVLGIGLDGKVLANLQYAGDDAYAPITSVREFGPWLYFGSLSYPAIGRLPLNQAVPSTAPPPAGWQTLPLPVETRLPHNAESEREAEEEEEGERKQTRIQSP